MKGVKIILHNLVLAVTKLDFTRSFIELEKSRL